MKGDLEQIEAWLAVTSGSDEDHAVVLNKLDPSGNAAIHGAVFGGHLEVVKFLAEHGASLVLPNGLGCSPTWLAAAYNHSEVLAFLLQRLDEKALLTPNKMGDSALLAAASKCHVEVCKRLLDQGGKKGVADDLKCAANESNDTALSVAIGAGIEDEEVLEMLCDPSIINLFNAKGVTPLLIACERDHVIAARKLLCAGADTSVVDAIGNPLLAVAAFSGSKRVVELLLKEQNLPFTNVPNLKSGCTPLWLATRAGHLDCARLLLQGGADATITSKEGLTPLQAAEKYKRTDMIELLTSFNDKII